MSSTTTQFDTLITDDELVAIAVDAQGPWPLPLPTVTVESAAGLKLSALKGARSLLTRGGFDREGNLSPQLDRLKSVVGAPTTLTVYVGDHHGAVINWGIGYGAVPVSDGWLLDEFNILGVHRLAWAESIGDFLVGLCEAAERGDLGLAEGLHLCVCRARRDGGEVVVVGDGNSQLITLDADSKPTSAAMVHDLAHAVSSICAR